MEKWRQLNGILWKRYLLRNRIWIFFFLLTGGFLFLAGEKSEKAVAYNGIETGIFAEDEGGMRLFSKLQEEEGIFRFSLYEDKEEMIRQIENGSLECGFVLPEGFYENLEKGRMMRQIILYYSPASSAHKISYEVVFSHLFELLSDKVLSDYVEYAVEEGIFPQEEILEEILEKNEYYSQNGSTFSFVYEQVGKEGEQEAQPLNTVKGCIAAAVFLMSLLGLADFYESESILKGLSKSRQRKVKESILNISILGSVILGGILLLLSGSGEGLKKEVLGLAVYFAVLEIYIRILKLLLRTQEAVYGLIPILVLGSLLFCPVFIQIKAYLPIAGLVEKLFPVSYYLNLP